ncbi:hypothetical protein BDV95DRAFT_492106 [Massariosphaeria phaeospora]|uniref:EamA domain-containing protein n=1 Tax=Massariosphaeria phaeospora TaxID=100035 RepID=A0A7C8M9X6_9PLEO|nr:hypothetical protein BDV95DRAFT_492106 [Massariosphaeria phaeospora]
MSLLPPSKGPNEPDKDLVQQQATESPSNCPNKAEAKPDGLLNATFSGEIRVPSPDPSLISIDDANNVRTGRTPGFLPLLSGRRHASRSPAPQPTVTGRLQIFWITNKGLALVLVSQFFGTLMNVTTRMLEVEVSSLTSRPQKPFQILFARMSITVLCSTFYMWRRKTEHFPFGLKEVRWLLVARGLTGFFGVFGMYYSLLYLPLADATVITFLAPSLACWACSFLINEPFTKMEQIAAYVSLFGVVLIARPISLFTSFSNKGAPNPSDLDPLPMNGTVDASHRLASDYDAVTPTQRAMAVGVAMLGVLGAAGAYTTIRWIGKRAHPLISVNYFAIWCTLVSIVAMFALPDVGFLLPAGLKDWCYLIFLGICGFVMQFLLAAGLQYEKSSRATNMVYCQMLFALFFDRLVFGTSPGALSIIGSSLIVGSAIYVAMHKEPGGKKEGQSRGRQMGDEERGLMSPILAGHIEDGNDADIQMRTLRV